MNGEAAACTNFITRHFTMRWDCATAAHPLIAARLLCSTLKPLDRDYYQEGPFSAGLDSCPLLAGVSPVLIIIVFLSLLAAHDPDMNGQVHANHVLYKTGAAVTEYRQILVVEVPGQFQVRIFGGTVVQLEPKFIAEGHDAEAYSHTTLKSALEDAEKEVWQSVDSGEWRPYHPAFPIK